MLLQTLQRRLVSLQSPKPNPFKNNYFLTSTCSRSKQLFFTPSRSHTSSASTRPRTLFTSPTLRRLGNGLRFPQRRHYSGNSSGPSDVMRIYWILLSVNGAVFLGYNYAKYTNNQPLQPGILKNTLLSLSSYDQNRYQTLLTSAFTHHGITHIAFNMLTLHTFASILSYLPSMRGINLLTLYLTAGLSSSAYYLYTQHQKLSPAGKALRSPSSQSSSSSLNIFSRRTGPTPEDQRAYNTPAIGASGAVMGVAALASCLMPRYPIYLMLIPIPIPLWCTTLLYGLVDAYFLSSETSRVAHAGHLGGLAAGLGYYVLFFRNVPGGVWRMLLSRLGR